ncbi:hypothetical protein ACE02B_01085 [Shewanella mangrovisoli]|uniref:hypothetical protein n=1 Tax=Shewanella mangrovisoli TaxID=2864211 RepID=UPI0035B7EFEE
MAKTPPHIEGEVLAMIAAGYSLAAVSSQFGLSYHTVRGIQKRAGIKSGEIKKQVILKYQNALKDSLASDFIRDKASALLMDDLALSSKLRCKLHVLLDELPDSPRDTKEAVLIARSLSAIATSLKLSNDTLRASFKLGEEPEINEDLPELIVREMLEKEIEEIKAEQKSIVSA